MLLRDYFPIPLRVTSWVRPSALSVILIVPVCGPFVCGLNATWIVQPFPIFSLAVQLLRSTKPPLIWILDTRSFWFPTFDNFTATGKLIFPTLTEPKLSNVGNQNLLVSSIHISGG